MQARRVCASHQRVVAIVCTPARIVRTWGLALAFPPIASRTQAVIFCHKEIHSGRVRISGCWNPAAQLVAVLDGLVIDAA